MTWTESRARAGASFATVQLGNFPDRSWSNHTTWWLQGLETTLRWEFSIFSWSQKSLFSLSTSASVLHRCGDGAHPQVLVFPACGLPLPSPHAVTLSPCLRAMRHRRWQSFSAATSKLAYVQKRREKMAPLKFEASLLSLRADLRHFSRPEIFPSYLNILTEKWVFGNKCRASGKLQLCRCLPHGNWSCFRRWAASSPVQIRRQGQVQCAGRCPGCCCLGIESQ